MNLEHIRRHLAAYRPARVEGGRAARAAVAMILRDAGGEPELLLIQRATRDDDPWSGHMAFPGGRHSPGDPDLIHTAIRETREEVGIDLRGHGRLLGTLDDLQAVARWRPIDLVISPAVYAVGGGVEPVPNRAEVESTVWVPLAFFHSQAARAVHHRSLEGVESEFPAYRYREYTVWGLTYRILEGFLQVVK